MKCFLIRCRRRKGMRERNKALKEENKVLRESLMRQPETICMGDVLFLRTVKGNYRVFKQTGVTDTPMG